MASSEAGSSIGAPSVPIPSPRFTVPARRLEDDLVWRVLSLIDHSEIRLRPSSGGAAEERPAREEGPEHSRFVRCWSPCRSCAVTDQPMLATRFKDVLFRQISPTMRHALGVPKPPEAGDLRGWNNLYRTIRTRFHGLIGLMDPSPVPKNRRFPPEIFEALLELGRSRHTEEEWAERKERLTWFANEILEMSVRTLPREVRRHWKGSVAVDDTVIAAFARPSKREKRTKKGVRPKTLRYSSDSDADWHHRDKQEGPDRDPEAANSVLGLWAVPGGGRRRRSR